MGSDPSKNGGPNQWIRVNGYTKNKKTGKYALFYYFSSKVRIIIVTGVIMLAVGRVTDHNIKWIYLDVSSRIR